ncbi:hypothetical protein L218DRAFT_1059814 [Marasmius fiardii PR-910]|nr:hypothetical protein L218DRAFT_1059814 [Marasmius fiardii PR-910]
MFTHSTDEEFTRASQHQMSTHSTDERAYGSPGLLTLAVGRTGGDGGHGLWKRTIVMIWSHPPEKPVSMTLPQEFQLTTQPEIKVSPITSYINGGIIEFLGKTCILFSAREPLFGCLDYRDSHFPYYQDGKNWRLAGEVIRKWDNLEYYLKILVLAMLETAQADDSVMTSQFSLWSLPASYHYKKHHNSLQDLQKAAASSWDAFLPLIAAGTLGYWWCIHRERTWNDIGWHARLQNRYNIHLQWFDDFASSEANSPDVL